MTGNYLINQHGLGRGRKKNITTAGMLIAEYEHFYLFRGKNGYRFSVSKNSLYCGHYSLTRVP